MNLNYIFEIYKDLNKSFKPILDMQNDMQKSLKCLQSIKIPDFSSLLSLIKPVDYSNFVQPLQYLNSLNELTAKMNSIFNNFDKTLKPITNIFNLTKNLFMPTFIKEFESNYKSIASENKERQLEESFVNDTIALIENKTVSIRQKRNFWVSLWQFLATKQLKNLLALFSMLITIFCPPIQININYNNKYEIRQIQQQEQTQKLRAVIGDTKLYSSPNRKSKVLFKLEKDIDIVEVLEINKKWIKVKIPDLEIVGWVLKKYTKRV